MYMHYISLLPLDFNFMFVSFGSFPRSLCGSCGLQERAQSLKLQRLLIFFTEARSTVIEVQTIKKM